MNVAHIADLRRIILSVSLPHTQQRFGLATKPRRIHQFLHQQSTKNCS